MGLVKAIQVYRSRCSRASRIRWFSRIRSVRIAGSSSTSAPCFRSFSAMVETSSLGRVTNTRYPNRGRCSYQANLSARVQTFPTTIMAGVSTPCFFTSSGRVATVATIRFCLAVVPFCKMAAGISGSIPARRRFSQISGRAVTPIRNTRVPLVSTRALKLIS